MENTSSTKLNIPMNHGRIKILSDLIPNGDIEHDKAIIPQIIENSLVLHSTNVSTMNNLISYYYNDTDIKNKEKNVRQDVNNMVAIPKANNACITINSYCFSHPFKYVSREAEDSKQAEVKAFNDALEADDTHNKLMYATLNSSITGIAYRYVEKPTQKEIDDKGMYFKSVSELDPTTTFCVYSNDISKEKILGVTYYVSSEIDKETNQKQDVTIYNVFTKWHRWIIEQRKNTYSVKTFTKVINGQEISFDAEPYKVESRNGVVSPKECNIPLIELRRKPDGTNDFELGLSIIDCINTIVSNTTDTIQENADYTFVFENVDIGEWDPETGRNEKMEKIKRAIQNHILAVESVPGIDTNPTVDILKIPVNGSEVTQILEWLNAQLQEVLFIPNRNTSSGGADTNSSVETRNGFRSLEDIAGIITSMAITSEKEFISTCLEIAQNIPGCPFANLKTKEIEIKPMRNKIDSLINSTQAFATMINAGVNRITAYVVSGLVADPIDTAAIDELEKDKEFQAEVNREIEKIKKVQAVTPQYNNDNESTQKVEE